MTNASHATTGNKVKINNNSLMHVPTSNRSNNSINLKNQRQTIQENMANRNKDSLLGMARSIPGVGLNNATAIMQNTNSTLDQR